MYAASHHKDLGYLIRQIDPDFAGFQTISITNASALTFTAWKM